ncbi:MAG: cytochrome P450 [Myxococcales bacterium]|nr:cytochrome P450 [Myxococcales bacterium]
MQKQPPKEPEIREYTGPRGYPLVGVLPAVGGDLLGYVSKIWREYGDHFSLRLGADTWYFVVHPEDVKYVLQANHRNYLKPYASLKDLLGEGLVAADGALWRRQRRLMQPMFSHKKMGHHFGAMLEGGKQLLSRWSRYEAGHEVDVLAEMHRTTQHVISQAMFGDALEGQAEQLCDALDITMHCLEQRMFLPSFAKGWPLPVNRRYKKAIHVVSEALQGLIDAHLAEPERFDDLLTLLLQSQDEETGEMMSHQQVMDEVITIFFAGQETTANALSWVWYILSLHPAIAQKMYKEIDSVLEGRFPTFEEILRLDYTVQVFEETLRLFPVAWIFQRQAIEEDILPSGYRIPKGSLVTLSPYLTHRHSAFWEDAEQFRPQRFVFETRRKQHLGAYYPFSSGPRVCMGISFAQIEATLLMVLLAQRYRLELAPNAQVLRKPTATLRPYPCLPMRLRPRTDGPKPTDVTDVGGDRARGERTKAGDGSCPMHGQRA